MTLTEQIEKRSKEIKTDGYPMSIGELINLYKDGDLTVFPEYQRYFRWSQRQKSDLIESILLGIPIPPIFVSQDKTGKWDIVDGLQRVSTILEFVGILKDSDGNKYSPSSLIETKFLPALDGKKWNDEYDKENSLTDSERRIIKRRKLNIMIIDSISNPTAKYELFQRLNTNGAELTEQEIRNCLMIMINREFYLIIDEICKSDTFRNIISLSERLLSEQYDKELVVRFFVAKNKDLSRVNSNEDMGKYLTNKILELIQDKEYDVHNDVEIFKKTVKLLSDIMSSNSFKRYNNTSKKFEGAFLLSAYESIFIGLSENLDYWNNNQDKLEEKIKSIYENSQYNSSTARGKRPILRFKELTELSRKIFKNEN